MIRHCAAVSVSIALAFVLMTTAVSAEVMSTEDLLKQKDQWDQWTNDGKKLQISGRMRGRVASRIHLQKLDIVFIPERGITIPDRLRSGRRITMSGRLTKGVRSREFRVTRFSIRPTDLEAFEEALASLPKEDADSRYELANKYARLATFYDDDLLTKEVTKARLRAIGIQRHLFRNDAAAIWKLVDPGLGFRLSERLRQSLMFESFLLRADKQDTSGLSVEIKSHLPGWNHTKSSPSADELQNYNQDKPGFYDDADDPLRRQLERLLYRSVRLTEIHNQLAVDGSNALQLARQIRRELPEEQTAAHQLAARYADFRLNAVDQMNRSRLQEVVGILLDVKREKSARQAVNQWLRIQVQQFSGRGLAGEMRVADEYLFAWEQWKAPEHREQGVHYLKQAWTTASEVAPDEAPAIAGRLQNLGWTRLHSQWMTTEEVNRLPENDLELAEREGRVVAGMSPRQVSEILGEPSRKIRMASTGAVEEIWVYGERHSSRITVRLRRATAQTADQATVRNVFQTSAR